MAIQVNTIKDYPKCGSQCNINMKAYGESDYWKELEKRKKAKLNYSGCIDLGSKGKRVNTIPERV